MAESIWDRATKLVMLVVVATVSLGGCTFFNLLGGVRFNTRIEGEITFRDKSSQDSNDYYFYWDWYKVRLNSSKTYTLELWTDPDIPIHFESREYGIDAGAWDDGDGSWDGYLLYDLPEGLGSFGFDFYLRSDSVGPDSWYAFQINEN